MLAPRGPPAYASDVMSRERLHELVETLEPAAAARLVARWDDVRLLAGEWEPDRRALLPEDEATLQEGLDDLAAGRTVDVDDLRARYLRADGR